MITEEVNHLESTIALGMKINKEDAIWQAAFNEYNKDNEPRRPLNMGCAPCYIKVLMHLKNKQ